MITQPMTDRIRVRELAAFDLHPTDPRPEHAAATAASEAPMRGAVMRESGTHYAACSPSDHNSSNGSASPNSSDASGADAPSSTDLLNSACEVGLEALGLDLLHAGTVHGWLMKLHSDGNRVRLMFIDLLRKLYEDGMYVECGYTTFRHYCEDELGLARTTAYEYVHTSVALDWLPGIRTGFKAGDLSWEQVRAMVRVATPETELEWIKLALKAPLPELFAKLRAARTEGRSSPHDSRFGLPNLNVKITLRMTAEEKQRLRSAAAILGADIEAAVGDRPVPGPVEGYAGQSHVAEGSLQGTLMRLADGILGGELRVVSADRAAQLSADNADEASDSDEAGDKRARARRAQVVRANSVVYHMYPDTERCFVETDDGPIAVSPERVAEIVGSADTIELGTKDILEVNVLPRGETDAPASASLVKKILQRDGFRCQNPGCRCRHNLQVHHIIWRSRGGPTVANNLITLCARCHSMIHHGHLSVVGTPATGLVWTRHPADETVTLKRPDQALRRVEEAIAAAPMPHDPSVSPWPGGAAGPPGPGSDGNGPGVAALRAIESDRLDGLKELVVGLGVPRKDAERQLGKILEDLVPPERLRGPDLGSVIPDDEAIVRAVLRRHAESLGPAYEDFPPDSGATSEEPHPAAGRDGSTSEESKAPAEPPAGEPGSTDSDEDVPPGNDKLPNVDS